MNLCMKYWIYIINKTRVVPAGSEEHRESKESLATNKSKGRETKSLKHLGTEQEQILTQASVAWWHFFPGWTYNTKAPKYLFCRAELNHKQNRKLVFMTKSRSLRGTQMVHLVCSFDKLSVTTLKERNINVGKWIAAQRKVWWKWLGIQRSWVGRWVFWELKHLEILCAHYLCFIYLHAYVYTYPPIYVYIYVCVSIFYMRNIKG